MAMVATCASRSDDVPLELEPAEVRYAYDQLGRLAAVADADGDTAVYRYDAVGNVVGIEHVEGDAAAEALSPAAPGGRPEPEVIGFSPAVVAPGDEVTVEGDHFAADPLLDAVVIDGTTYATVRSASETELVVTVPPTATSGRLSVSTPDGTARGDDDLVVVPEGFEPGAVVSADRIEPGDTLDVDLAPGELAVVTVDAHRAHGLVAEVAEVVPGGDTAAADDTGDGEEPEGDEDDGAEADREWTLCELGFTVVAPGGVPIRDGGDHPGGCEEGRVVLARVPMTGRYTLVLAPGEEGRGEDEAVAVSLRVDEVDPDELPAEDEDPPVIEPEPGAELPTGLDLTLLEPPRPQDRGPVPGPGGLEDGVAGLGVDLATGVMAVQQTDVVIDDLVPLSVSRSYDAVPPLGPVPIEPGAFGTGSPLGFYLDLRTSPNFQYADLRTATKDLVSFVRSSGGADAMGAVFAR